MRQEKGEGKEADEEGRMTELSLEVQPGQQTNLYQGGRYYSASDLGIVVLSYANLLAYQYRSSNAQNHIGHDCGVAHAYSRNT